MNLCPLGYCILWVQETISGNSISLLFQIDLKTMNPLSKINHQDILLGFPGPSIMAGVSLQTGLYHHRGPRIQQAGLYRV